MYRGADKSLARPTPRYILFDGENISFDASLVIYIISTNIPPIMIINRIYEHQNLLSVLWRHLMTCVACVLCTVQAKRWLWLPDDGFFVNRNMLEQPL